MSSKLRGCTPGAEKVCPAVMLLQAHRILYIYDRVNLDVAKARESVPAGVKGLHSRGGQAHIKLTTIYSLPGTNQSTSKAQDGSLISIKLYNRLVAHTGRHSPRCTLPLGEHSGYSAYHCDDLR